jgi:probable F420-dependent oxidoreductase
MRFGLSYNTAAYGTDPGSITAVAQQAEDLGFESFYAHEHLVFHPGATLGGNPVPADTAVADPLALLGLVAASTERLLLGTAVLLLPYRHPVVLAKQLATLDVLSGGRLRLVTVGLGSLPREASAVGVDFGTRGRRADEAIDVLRALWVGGDEGVTHRGRFFTFEEVCVFPKPVSGATLPIHVGGSSTAAARRAGARGDGYFPGGMLAPSERLAQLDVMRQAAIDVGRDPAGLEYTRWGSLDLDEARVRAYERQGVDRLVVAPPAAPVATQLTELTAFADRVSLHENRAAAD